MQIRLIVTVYQITHLVDENMACNANVYFFFEIKSIPDKEGALADAVSRVNPLDEMEQMGLDFTIHEVTQCMTPIQM